MSIKKFNTIVNILATENASGLTSGALYVSGGINTNNVKTGSLSASSYNISNYINTTNGTITLSTTNATVLFTGLTMGNMGVVNALKQSDPNTNLSINYFMSATGGGSCHHLFTNGTNITGSVDSVGNFYLQKNTTGTVILSWSHLRFIY